MVSTTMACEAANNLNSGFAERMTDAELLLEYRLTGNEALFAQLFHRHERGLLKYLRRCLADESAAEDALQMTFLKVHDRRDQFDARRSFHPWLYQIATNQAIDATRRKRRRHAVSLDDSPRVGGEKTRHSYLDTLQDEQPHPARRMQQQEHTVWLQRAVERLPEALRQVVRLIFFQGLKYREAADALSLPVGTVKSRRHAALMRLRELWAESHPNQLELE